MQPESDIAGKPLSLNPVMEICMMNDSVCKIMYMTIMTLQSADMT